MKRRRELGICLAWMKNGEGWAFDAAEYPRLKTAVLTRVPYFEAPAFHGGEVVLKLMDVDRGAAGRRCGRQGAGCDRGRGRVIVIDASHPFYPHFRAMQIAEHRPAGTYPLPFEEWMLWHLHFRLRGAGFIPLTPDEATQLLQPTPEVA